MDGGPTRDNFLMQFQADIASVPVTRNRIEELSATGAMYMGGMAMGIWNRPSDFEKLRKIDRTFSPKESESWRERNYSGWKRAVKNLLNEER